MLFTTGEVLNENIPAWEASCLLSFLFFLFFLVGEYDYICLIRSHLHLSFIMNEWEWDIR